MKSWRIVTDAVPRLPLQVVGTVSCSSPPPVLLVLLESSVRLGDFGFFYFVLVSGLPFLLCRWHRWGCFFAKREGEFHVIRSLGCVACESLSQLPLENNDVAVLG